MKSSFGKYCIFVINCVNNVGLTAASGRKLWLQSSEVEELYPWGSLHLFNIKHRYGDNCRVAALSKKIAVIYGKLPDAVNARALP